MIRRSIPSASNVFLNSNSRKSDRRIYFFLLQGISYYEYAHYRVSLPSYKTLRMANPRGKHPEGWVNGMSLVDTICESDMAT